jgi:hypothetical protein
MKKNNFILILFVIIFQGCKDDHCDEILCFTPP